MGTRYICRQKFTMLGDIQKKDLSLMESISQITWLDEKTSDKQSMIREVIYNSYVSKPILEAIGYEGTFEQSLFKKINISVFGKGMRVYTIFKPLTDSEADIFISKLNTESFDYLITFPSNQIETVSLKKDEESIKLINFSKTKVDCKKCTKKYNCLAFKVKGQVNSKYQTIEKEFSMKGVQFGNKQLEYIESDADAKMCNSHAGTGKTFIIMEQIRRLQAQGVKGKDILAVSFTTTAAKELAARYKATLRESIEEGIVPIEDGLDEDEAIEELMPHISTFHSLSTDLIAEFYKEFKLREGFRVISGIESIALEYENAMGTVIASKDFRKYDKNLKSYSQTSEYWEFKEYCSEHNIVLLSDVIDYLIRAVKLGLLDIKHLIVDEFQDSSYEEILACTYMFEKTLDKLSVLGDTSQSIYTFRGGTHMAFQEIDRKLDGFNKSYTVLDESFRMTPEITEKSNNLLDLVGGEHVISARESSGGFIGDITRTDMELILLNSKDDIGVLSASNIESELLFMNLRNKGKVFMNFGPVMKDYPSYKLMKSLANLASVDNRLYSEFYGNKYGNTPEKFIKYFMRYDNLSKYVVKLIKSAASFDKFTTFRQISHFLEAVQGEQISIVFDDDEKIVISSIHRSKGLEFNTVMLNNADNFNIDVLNPSHKMNYVNENGEVEIRELNQAMTSEEKTEVKVLFVSLTRAKNNFYAVRG